MRQGREGVFRARSQRSFQAHHTSGGRPIYRDYLIEEVGKGLGPDSLIE